MIGRRTNNFGDLLGPLVVKALCERESLAWPPSRPGRLFSVGSVLHLARDGDVVWGSGVNGKVDPAAHRFSHLDVRAARGPRTRAFLRTRGVDVPEVFGDPALLLPQLVPALREWSASKTRQVTAVPNLNEWHLWRSAPAVLSPRANVWHCLRTIAASERVIASSLHGIVVAEALGIPATLIASPIESPFKYHDYFEGTGREMPAPYPSLERAFLARPREPDLSGWDPASMIRAFPRDLWADGRHTSTTTVGQTGEQ
ncbi:polysaccharide pyruvyl transferase family protein [Antribacter sp. KLBMP9083]|uniref:Polysaccharide pyruvyl transferase family protein n=1 Tax=Antribacter soli TaxID=2910976 RepID=A0AA41QEZ8_9MICO|nr:polysaccharide pyruvyl transferase family protein [Antribacter soli]MCF4122239.1 polysaccharide pyruvyl transferase family protein [Antribacter soli]